AHAICKEFQPPLVPNRGKVAGRSSIRDGRIIRSEKLPVIRMGKMRSKTPFALLISTAATLILGSAHSQELQVNASTRETPEQFAERTKWWREAKFGMFIHWGVYAVPADATTKDGKKSAGEWYFFNKQAQMKDYEKFASQFNPVKFNARQWVK